jgi:hypothetical protein
MNCDKATKTNPKTLMNVVYVVSNVFVVVRLTFAGVCVCNVCLFEFVCASICLVVYAFVRLFGGIGIEL